MMSRWPTVTGSNVPGQMAVTLLGISVSLGLAIGALRISLHSPSRRRIPRHEERDARVTVAFLPHDGPGQPGRRAGGGLDDQHRAGDEHPPEQSDEGGTDLLVRSYGGSANTRVYRAPRRASAARARRTSPASTTARGAGDARPAPARLGRAAPPARRGAEVGAQGAQRRRRRLHEGAAAGAARERLDAERAAAGEDVEDDVAGERAGRAARARARASGSARRARRTRPRAPCPRWAWCPGPAGAERPAPRQSPPTTLIAACLRARHRLAIGRRRHRLAAEHERPGRQARPAPR